MTEGVTLSSFPSYAREFLLFFFLFFRERDSRWLRGHPGRGVLFPRRRAVLPSFFIGDRNRVARTFAADISSSFTTKEAVVRTREVRSR